MLVMEIVQQHIDKIKKLCRQYHVQKLYIFGSVLTNKFNPQSDIDFLVDFENVNMNEYADNFFDFKYSLEDLLHRDIDLLESKAISNPYLKQNIDSTKKIIYE